MEQQEFKIPFSLMIRKTRIGKAKIMKRKIDTEILTQSSKAQKHLNCSCSICQRQKISFVSKNYEAKATCDITEDNRRRQNMHWSTTMTNPYDRDYLFVIRR